MTISTCTQSWFYLLSPLYLVTLHSIQRTQRDDAVSPLKIEVVLWQYYHSVLLHNMIIGRNVQHDLHKYRGVDW